MKKSIFLLVLITQFSFARAQTNFPSYPQVLKEFFSKYTGSDDNDNFTSFSKKAGGWYVQEVDRLNADSTLRETLFWSVQKKKYLDISDKYDPANDDDLEEKISSFLADTYTWNGFDRCAYFGYNEWYADMLRDFSLKENASDTLLEGLARANSAMITSFLWYQNGGYSLTTDSLQKKLDRTQMPSDARIAQVKKYIDNSAAIYQLMEKKYPQYRMMVGNAHLKSFNEYLNGYTQMMMARREEDAKQFLDKASLDQVYKIQAKNYLNSCDSNSILIAYGDNDTYQLWYLQEKERYRKDVTVINASLLGFTPYLDMLKAKKIVNLRMPKKFYSNTISDISYFREQEKYNGPNKVKFDDIARWIYSEEFPVKNPVTEKGHIANAYPVQDFTISTGINIKFFDKKTGSKRPGTISVKLDYYTFLGDLALLDIVDGNIDRPIYFTTLPKEFENNCLRQGICMKLLPDELMSATGIKNYQISRLEKFVTETFIPVISNKTIVSYDGDNSFTYMMAAIIEHYSEDNNADGAKKWLKFTLSKIPDPEQITFASLQILANAAQDSKDIDAMKKLYELCGKKETELYLKPIAGTLFVSKKDCLEFLNDIKTIFIKNKIDTPEINRCIKKVEGN